MESSEEGLGIKERYFQRDWSWIRFNARVLQEAADPDVPLFDRIKFLAIYSSNLDEFFKVRMAAIKGAGKLKKKKISRELGESPKKLWRLLNQEIGQQLKEFGEIYENLITPELLQKGMVIYSEPPVAGIHLQVMQKFFRSRVLAYMQPVWLTAGMEPPFLQDKMLYLVLQLRKLADEEENGKTDYALLNIPSDQMARFISLPKVGDTYYFAFLDDVLRANLSVIFPAYQVLGCYSIKVTRDADLGIADEYEGDLVEKIRKQLDKRQIGVPSRFLFDKQMPEDVRKFLQDLFFLDTDEMVEGGRYHNFSDFFSLPNPFFPSLESSPLQALDVPYLDNAISMFSALDQQDVLLHFPYQSYDYVLRFFNEAAVDPQVTSIKVTVYRIATSSLIANALISAAKNGKTVTVFVEVQARFDEANNLRWAAEMEKAGVRIIYSIPGLKVHAKVAVLSRGYGKSARKYAFLGTGNFNEKTAQVYADHGLLTSNPLLTEELETVFEFLENPKNKVEFKWLLVAQVNMIERFKKLIDREIQAAKSGLPSGIIIKLNNLEERSMIDKLYEASQAGVSVQLIIRGICCLIPAQEGLSENIKVRRLVGRFLEHARIFVFHHQGNPEVFLASADWMNRNLHRRVEVAFPVLAEKGKAELLKLIALQLADNQKGGDIDCLHRDNRPTIEEEKPINAQDDFYKYLQDLHA